MITGPRSAAFLAPPASWLNWRLVSVVMVMVALQTRCRNVTTLSRGLQSRCARILHGFTFDVNNVIHPGRAPVRPRTHPAPGAKGRLTRRSGLRPRRPLRRLLRRLLRRPDNHPSEKRSLDLTAGHVRRPAKAPRQSLPNL